MKYTALLAFFLLVIVGGLIWLVKKPVSQTYIQLGNKKITIEVANTPEKQTQGLSGRQSLKENSGMLFIFPEKDRHSFWMKDMQFALDFIWIDGETIVDITYNVPPPGREEVLPTYQPKQEVDKVLEINAGVASESGVKIGDVIPLSSLRE